MKTEATPHAHASPTTQRAHRPAGPAAGASDLAQTDPFAQLLAGLFADDPGVTAVDGITTDATTDAQARKRTGSDIDTRDDTPCYRQTAACSCQRRQKIR
jgi:hypothetical protein